MWNASDVASSFIADSETAPRPREASRAVVVMCTFVTRGYRESGPLSPEEIAWRYGRMALSLLGASRAPQFESPTYQGA
ncbi:hypothetical protein [Streptomyces sp. San01]|uniref:hypothetical protein n=1 Tax=Streptomyces antnestii TaxID=2494256 RepID=UPI0016746D62